MPNISLLAGARAFARDFPRDQMPPGYLWDLVDYVPVILDAQLTGRGGWPWGSTVMGGDGETGILAGYTTGDKLLIQADNGQLYEVSQIDPYTATARGAVPRAVQNPVQLFDTVIHFDKDGLVVPKLITAPGGVVTVGDMISSAPKARYGTSYKSYVISGGVPGSEDTLYYSQPGNPGTTAYDPLSVVRTSHAINGLIGLRSVLIVFHQGMVERVRGTTPPHGTVVGDLFLEPLTDRVGLGDARTIASWNDNVIWADEHGVHISDGAVIRNLIAQGGLIDYWRPLYLNRSTIAATTFLDNYIITVRRTDGIVDTLVCDLPQRQWYRFSHFPMQGYVGSSGGSGMERVWGCVAGQKRLARIGPVFFPTLETSAIVDADGTSVLPSFETPWYRVSKKEGRKRIRFFLLSYDVRAQPPVVADDLVMPWRPHAFGRDEDGGVLAALLDPGLHVVQNIPMLDVGYIDSPQQTAYQHIGNLPDTDRYRRYRLPVGQHPYGIAFRVKQLTFSTATRIFDLAVSASPEDEGRL